MWGSRGKKIAAVVLCVFMVGVGSLPSLAVKAFAANKEQDVTGKEVQATEVAGEEGGKALFAGMSKGTVVTAVVVTAVVAGAVIAVSGNDDSDSSTNTTTNH